MKKILAAVRKIRKSIWVILLAITASCTWLWFHYQGAVSQKEFIANHFVFSDVPNRYYYDYQIDSTGKVKENAISPIPEFLLTWLGVDFFHTIEKFELAKPIDSSFPLKGLKHLKISVYPKTYFLRKLPKLQTLNFSPMLSTNVGGLLGHNNLKDLSCSTDQLDIIGTIPNLNRLRLNTEASSWTGLGKLKQLKHLTISYSGLSDFESLKSLNQLETLSIQCGRFPDLSCLNQLPKLKWVDLSVDDESYLGSDLLQRGNRKSFEQTVPQAPHRKLRSLKIKTSKINHLENLETLGNLQFLKIETKGQTDLSTLLKIPNLKFLALTTGQLSISGSLAKDSNLETLCIGKWIDAPTGGLAYPHFIDKSPTVDLKKLPTIASLKKMSISNCNVLSLEEIKRQSEIHCLQLIDCQFQRYFETPRSQIFDTDLEERKYFGSLQDVSRLPKLSSLTISGFAQDQLDGLENCVGLRSLKLSVSSQSPLPPLYPLQKKHLSQISKLKGLEKLQLKGYLVNDLDFVSPLTSVKELRIEGPEIRSLEPIKNLKKLELLSVNTRIEREGKTPQKQPKELDITPLKNCPNLKTLFLRFPKFKGSKTILQLPKLRQINFLKISEWPPKIKPILLNKLISKNHWYAQFDEDDLGEAMDSIDQDHLPADVFESQHKELFDDQDLFFSAGMDENDWLDLTDEIGFDFENLFQHDKGEFKFPVPSPWAQWYDEMSHRTFYGPVPVVG